MPSATTDLASILSTAIGDGNVAQLSGGTYTVTQPIVIHIDSTIQGPIRCHAQSSGDSVNGTNPE